ncbi:hypothetical protein CHUAL_012505 [Chamberlinius hualienensis]
MMRTTIVLAMILGVSMAATLNKKDGYGGSSAAAYSTHTSYGTSGSSYDAGSVPSYSSGSDYGSTGSASYNSGGSSSYNSGSTDQGNLYYYYYPVTNHSSGQSYAGGNNNNNNYYPPAPIPSPYHEPLGGLLSLVGAIDVNSLILPALLIGGVALLLPAILNCDLELGTCVIPLPFSNGRGGRQMSDWSLQQATIPQMIDSAYRVYDAVNDNEKCMQRVVCEFGGMMRNVRGKETFFSVMEYFASPSMKKQLYVLRQGALAVPSSNPACSKFECSKLDNKVE